MPLSIKNEEAERLARDLARTMGETLTAAVTNALRERLDRQRRHQAEDIVRRIRRLSDEVRALPVLDPRHPEDIVGYDDQGSLQVGSFSIPFPTS